MILKGYPNNCLSVPVLGSTYIYPKVLYHTRKVATNRAPYPRLATCTRRFSTIPGESGKRAVEKTERRVGGGGKRETRDGTRGTIWCFWCSRSRRWCEQIGDGSGACGVTNVAEVLGNKWV